MFQGKLQAGSHELVFGDVTFVMGVINVSPESKNPHTIAETPAAALELARLYRRWGVDLIDIGGQSSHFENPTIATGTEVDRVAPVVDVLARDGFIVSIDTWKPEVARAAVAAGAAIVNDTGGLRHPDMVEIVVENPVAAVAVHVDGENPHDVQDVVLSDVKADLTAKKFAELVADLPAGVSERLIIDPGIAINYRGDYGAYTRLQLEVIRSSGSFSYLDRPLLIPIPRKRDIHWVSAYVTMALEYGADIIRVHDVAIAADLTGLWGRTVPR